MTASATDKLKRVGQRGTKTTLASPGKAPSDTSVTLTNPANWETETGIFCSFYEEDPITKKEKDGTYTVWEGVVVGSQVVALNQVYGPTGVTYPAGTIAVMHINSAWANDVIDALRSFMNQDRTLKKDPIKAALGISGDTPPDWNLLPVTPTVTGNFGQREHELTFDGVDYRTTIGEGTKLRLPRTGTTPTQSMKFDPASSQYASKSSPTGITPTTTLTCEAWVHLDKYPTGAGSQTSGTIISRYNTTGFICRFDTFGRLMLSGYTASDHRTVTAQQSVELGRKVHVSASINTATNTGVITCDGVVVSTIMSGGATSLVQAGNLEIGAYDGANGLINGKLSQVRIWKTVRTPQEIRDNMNVEITTHPDLVANFPGNGTFNDVSGNNNHLTPSGGAIATYVDNPFHDVEYAVVTTKPAFTGGNTIAKVNSMNFVLPNAPLGAASYSNVETPHGFVEQSSGAPHGIVYTDTAPTTATGAGTLKSISLSNLVIGRTYFVNWQTPVLGQVTNAAGTINVSMYLDDGTLIADDGKIMTYSSYQNPRGNLTGWFQAKSTSHTISCTLGGNGVVPAVQDPYQRVAVYSLPEPIAGQ